MSETIKISIDTQKISSLYSYMSEKFPLLKNKATGTLNLLEDKDIIEVIMPQNISNQTKNQLKGGISDTLAEFIIKEYELDLIKKEMKMHYTQYNKLEQKEIINFALKNISEEDSNLFKHLFKIRRRAVISRSLLNYFDESIEINLDGFMNFRLKEYIKEIQEIISDAEDDYLKDREYTEFIRLLKYFVEMQDPKYNRVYIVKKDEKYEILDEKYTPINVDLEIEFSDVIGEKDMPDKYDMLISTLVSLAPKEIIIEDGEGFENKHLLDTMKKVFKKVIVKERG